MRQRNAVVALVVAGCLLTAGCGADDQTPAPAGAPSPAPTAEPSPSADPLPTAEPEPSETPADPPSSPPDDSPAPPPTEAGPDGFADPPYRRPLPRPTDGATTPPGPSAPGPSTPGPTASPTRPSPPSAAPTAPPSPKEVGGPSGTLAFGQTYVWDNGLTLTAGRPAELATEEGFGEDPGAPATDPASATDPEAAPAPQPASEPAAEVRPASPAPSATATVVTVDFTIVNGTDKPINTSFFVAMTSGGADAPAVNSAGLAGPPEIMLQPGRTARFTMGFEVKDPADLTMEVRPAYHYVSALFVRPAGAQG